MFASGSADMHDFGKSLLQMVAQVIGELPNRISITGHTDSIPFKRDNDSYGNWELSSDRANASRRGLVAGGFPNDRIAKVTGRAGTEPLIEEDPRHSTNRRISVVLLREAPVLPPKARLP